MHEPSTGKPWRHRWRERLVALYRSRRLRRWVLIALVALLLYVVATALAVPALLRHYAQTRAGALLGRPVAVQAIRFNPLTLKLSVAGLHVGDADGRSPFVDADRVVVNASWTSLFRLAPVLDALELDRPRIALVRSAPQRFNFSDLIERFAGGPPKPGAEPARFALSNIVVHGGEIAFDDRTLGTRHRVDQLELGIPFIANLPRDTGVFVQPLLAMRVDGSPLRIQGQTKPFDSSLESIVGFHLERLDLPRYLGYVPAALPFAIPRGQLSGDLELHFIDSKPTPQLRLGGTLALDDFALTGKDGAAILALGHGSAALADVQPLLARYRFGAVSLEQASMAYTRQAGGRSNFDALTGGGQAKATPPDPKAPPTEVGIASLALGGSRFVYTDATGAAPATLTLDALKGNLSGLNTQATAAAAVAVSGRLNGGGVASRGKLGLAAGRYAGTLTLKDVDAAPLQALAAPTLQAEVRQARLDADGSMQVDWHDAFNLHVEPARLGLRNLALGKRGAPDTLVAWKALDATLARFDLAGRQAQLDALAIHGLDVTAQRNAAGHLDLASLADSAPAAKPAARPAGGGAAPAWHWRLDRLGLDDGALTLTDHASGKPARVRLQALKAELQGLSDQLRQPFKLTASGTVGKGSFEAGGTLRPEPLRADLKIRTRQFELAGFQPYVDMPLNVSVARAQLTSDGQLRYAGGAQPRVSYRGRATLARVLVQDKLTGDDFLRWRTLALDGIDFRHGEGPLHLALGDIALSDFYARVIVNANGRLNLADVAGQGAAQPVSVTRAENEQPTAAPPKVETPAPAASTAAATAAAPAPPSDIRIGQIMLARGQLNYTDDFIKPNYSANITALTGKVGAFGTQGGPPAEVVLQGQLDDSSPVDIGGSINPLAPVAFLDINGKANGVELTHLSAYSSKYTGYPILKGRLNADVHYLLDQGKLKAENHIFIDQLTFGDRIESPGISHLPVKLAVALLKNSRGEIDVRVPVSGSLDDPQFSLGGVIWRAFVNLIAKAATAPFRLLASAFGGGGNGGQDLGYVEFAPGSALLDATAKDRLAQIVKALGERPSLNLDIVGRIDPARDEQGLRQVTVDELVRHEQGDDQDTDGVAPPPPLSPEDYDRYLERAYKHAKFDKPRNFIGLTKSQPPEEMKKMLEANVTVDQNALRQLADRRAAAVRKWLEGKIDAKRVFLLAPRLDAKGIDDQGKTTRVDFGLH
ncbi:DUF748 domain-containing protein [Frateuria defendens]|uniref:DUF748 domain-containing protein n=1 Tax=Frateuria defendens TaxID=2219559 RepID=UPI00066FB562|nr:DUF748 domain-containing protein [Frateuria defendens]